MTDSTGKPILRFTKAYAFERFFIDDDEYEIREMLAKEKLAMAAQSFEGATLSEDGKAISVGKVTDRSLEQLSCCLYRRKKDTEAFIPVPLEEIRTTFYGNLGDDLMKILRRVNRMTKETEEAAKKATPET